MCKHLLNKTKEGSRRQNRCGEDIHTHSRPRASRTSEVEADRPVGAFLLRGENIIKDLSPKLSFSRFYVLEMPIRKLRSKVSPALSGK